jgi:hypothetical protein
MDALVVGIESRKVNFILDADIRSFFDTVDQEWLIRFVEHRVGDRRIVRTGVQAQAVTRETSRFPYKERLHMPGSQTTRDWTGPRDIASVHVAFRGQNRVGIPG